MANLTEVITENTISFYQSKEDKEKEQELYYDNLYKNSLNGISENIKMFDELGIVYELVNQKGKAVLTTEVLFFNEDENPKLILELISEYKEEQGKGKTYSYYRINAGEDTTVKQIPFIDEITLSIEYSNSILNILEKRPLGEFLNNFGKLYTNPLKK
jgi:hypothetical protein